MANNTHHFRQVRGWQIKKLLATADSMANLKIWVPSEVILYRDGEKADSNLVETLKAVGFEADKLYHVGQSKASGETLFLKAEADDKAAKKGGCRIICDGNHKALARWLAATVAGVELKAIEAAVEPALADRFAYEANLIQQTGAALATQEKLEAIVELRRLGVYKIQANLPFDKNDRLSFQNYWWRSEAVVNAGFRPDQVAKLHWQVAKKLCEGQTLEQALGDAEAKKNAAKVITAESIKMAAKMAENGDPAGKEELTAILKAAAAGDNDAFKRCCAEYYSKRKVTITAA